MLNMKQGCKIKNPEELFEQYEKIENGYVPNINVEKIHDVLKEFISKQKSLVFFFLEVPSNLNDENEIKQGVPAEMHKDIYYIDSLNREKAFDFLDLVGELLANDGLASFGFGSQSNNDEISVGKYNVVTIYSIEDNSYDDLFEKFKIPQTKKLVTAWDFFTMELPGISEKIDFNGKDVYSIIDDFKGWGLYFAERKKEL